MSTSTGVFVLLMVTLSSVVNGEVPGSSNTVPCHKPTTGKVFLLGFTKLTDFTYGGQKIEPDITLKVVVESGHSSHITLFVPVSDGSSTKLSKVRSYDVFGLGSILVNSSLNLTRSAPGFNDVGSVVITSSSTISLIAVYHFYGGTDVHTVIWPIELLSTEYILPSNSPNTAFIDSASQLLIIAVNDSTTVHISGYEININIGLERHGTYFDSKRSADLSGTRISSNHHIAVFTAVSAGYPGDHHYSYATSSMSLQAPPIDHSAVYFIIPAVSTSFPGKYKIRIYATQDDTHVTIYERPTPQHVHVYKEIFYEITVDNGAIEISSNKPISVTQILISRDAINNRDVEMSLIIIPAVSQYQSSYELYINENMQAKVMVSSDEASGLLIDNKPLQHHPVLQATPSAASSYSIIDVDLTARHTKVSHIGNVPFGLILKDPSGTYTPSIALPSSDCPHVGPSGIIDMFQSTFNQHEGKHKNEAPCKCSICSQINFSESKHKDHSLGILPKDPLCVVRTCGKDFKTKYDLREHSKRERKGDSNLQCQHCLSKFASKRELADHSDKHTSEKNHKCTICDKSFRYKSNLTRHIKVHNADQTTYKCAQCEMDFNY